MIEPGNEVELSIDQMRVLTVLQKIQSQVIANVDDSEAYAHGLEDMLNMLHDSDFFGSEASCDPRGDFRDGAWDMWNTQEYPS
jgi:hypothetical protein